MKDSRMDDSSESPSGYPAYWNAVDLFCHQQRISGTEE